MAKKMAKKTQKKSRPAKKNIVSFFETKLEAEWGPVDLKHALEKRAQDILILDTRAPEAYQEEHIPQAINIPTAELPQRLAELPKNKEIVPYCWTLTCHLATRAALILAQKGYQVHELAGGIGTWKEYDMPVETKETAAVN